MQIDGFLKYKSGLLHGHKMKNFFPLIEESKLQSSVLQPLAKPLHFTYCIQRLLVTSCTPAHVKGLILVSFQRLAVEIQRCRKSEVH